jgi:hypothetical protein
MQFYSQVIHRIELACQKGQLTEILIVMVQIMVVVEF